MWLAVAGSDHGLAPAPAAAGQRRCGTRPAQLAAKIAAREQLAQQTTLSLPGDRLVQNAIDWGKQNLADLTQTAENLQIRWTNQGKQFPAPLGTVPSGHLDRRGLSRTTRGSSAPTGSTPRSPRSRSASSRPSRATCARCATCRTSSTTARAWSSHEVVSDGSVYFGHDSRQANPDGTTTYDFNTDETVKFPSAVALVWRWTGDNRFRDEMYDFAVRNLHYVVQQRSTPTTTAGPRVSGNVERTGMGPEKLDNAVYLIRGLYDLADLAQSKHDGATEAWATHLARTAGAATSTAPGGTRPRSSTPTR